jgi:hypothetical protein
MKILLCVDLCVYTMCLTLDVIGRKWKQPTFCHHIQYQT